MVALRPRKLRRLKLHPQAWPVAPEADTRQASVQAAKPLVSAGSVEGHSQDAESPGPARTFENRHELVAHEMKAENKVSVVPLTLAAVPRRLITTTFLLQAIKSKLAAERERSQAAEARCTAIWSWTIASTSISALLVLYLLRDRQRDRQALQELRGRS